MYACNVFPKESLCTYHLYILTYLYCLVFKVKLADRSLMPGDVVRRLIKGQDSQRGYVRNTNVNCHLQVIGKNKVITNVNSKDLEPLRVSLFSHNIKMIQDFIQCFCWPPKSSGHFPNFKTFTITMIILSYKTCCVGGALYICNTGVIDVYYCTCVKHMHYT